MLWFDFRFKNKDTLRVSKFRVNLWISYFFDDITTIFGPEKTLIRYPYFSMGSLKHYILWCFKDKKSAV